MKIYVEIRGCAGGKEADVFAEELMAIYLKYARKNGLSSEVLNGDKTIILSFDGKPERIKPLLSESGIHKVQRVSKGKVHTSTASVAVIEVNKSSKLTLNMKDLDITSCKASGSGGQKVNTTDSAVRVKHIPTGIVVTCQNERSQHQNKAVALEILQSKLESAEKENIVAKTNNERRKQIGFGDRSESRRTYNYARSEIVDHINNKKCRLSDIINDANLLVLQ